MKGFNFTTLEMCTMGAVFQVFYGMKALIEDYNKKEKKEK